MDEILVSRTVDFFRARERVSEVEVSRSVTYRERHPNIIHTHKSETSIVSFDVARSGTHQSASKLAGKVSRTRREPFLWDREKGGKLH